jgi:hypothetical protein
LAHVSAETLRAYAQDLVQVSDSGKLLAAFITASYNKCYIYGDEYRGHPILARLSNIPVKYIPNSGHFVMYDCPQQVADVMQKTV